MAIRIQRTINARALLWACVFVVLATHLANLRLTFTRWICVDEFEHLHAAWCITPAGGSQVPYRDFFEHHTPLLYYVLAPVLAIIRPEASYDRAWTAVIICRVLMWVLAAATLYLIYRLGRAAHSRIAPILAAMLALCSMKFIDRAVEIRPDLISVPCILTALCLSLSAVRDITTDARHRGQRATPGGRRLGLSGILFGLAVLATPKTLFALLGYAPAILICFFRLAAVGGRRGWQLPSWRVSLRLGLLHLAGFLLPLALALTLLAARHAAWDFIHHNFLLNARWKFHLDKWAMVGEVIYENPLLIALGMAGLAAALIRCLRGRVRGDEHFILAATCVGLIAGIFLIPVPYDEYFLMLIPLLAIYAARTLIVGAGVVCRATRGRWRNAGTVDVAIAAVAVTVVVLKYRPPMLAHRLQTGLWILAACGVLVAILMRARFALVAALLMGILGYAFPRYLSLFALTSENTKRTMAYVHAHTSPADTVMDGWDKITAPFRPHAWRFFFLHREILPMITSDEWDELRHAMGTGNFHPAIIVFDVDNQAIPEPLATWIRAHYEPIAADEIGLPATAAPLWRKRQP